MKAFLQPLMVILLFVFVRSLDLIFPLPQVLRIILYAVVALLALVVIILSLAGV